MDTVGADPGKLLLPDIMSPDGTVAKRTLVICPLCVVSPFAYLPTPRTLPLAA